MFWALFENTTSSDFITCLASFADEMMSVGVWPSFRRRRGPCFLAREAAERWGRLPSWWRLPIIGSCGGEGGELLWDLVGRSLRKRTKRKRKMKENEMMGLK